MSSLTKETLTRRDFLAWGGATAAGLTLGELGRRQLARADERAQAWRGRGQETWATSVCRECPAACGVRARLIDGVPVKLEGNPLCPIGRGRLCAKGQAALESYFDPDRLTGPARRAGRRGEGRWEALTWEAAVGLLASHLRPARGQAGDIVAIAAEEHGPLADAWTRFWTGAGARIAWTPAATAARLAPRLAALTGAEAPPFFDLEHAGHVLSFGAPLVEDWLSPVWAQRSYGRFRRGRPRSRGRLVQVDGRRSLTARKADEWLPVTAEQQAVLACGVAAVLLRENRVDRGFLDALGGNLAAFEREAVARFSPDDIAATTGVPVVTVLRLARELAAGPRGLVVVAADADPALADAAFALNALIGAFERPGGVFASPHHAVAARQDATALLREIASGRVRPRVLALRDASALRAPAAPPDPASGLERAELVVSFSPFLDETAAVADLLMPAHTALETWHALVPAPAAGIEALTLAAPAVRPRLGTADLAGTLRATSDAAGGELAAASGWKSSEDLVASALDRLWGERRGAPYGDPYDTEWVRQLEKGGWWVSPARSREEFGASVLKAGGWADPFLAPGAIRESLRARGGLSFALPPAQALPRGRAGDTQYPLLLSLFVPAVVNLAGNPNQPVLFELLGQPDGLPWRVWAELSPETAREHGVANGATIRIVSPHGSIEAVAIHAERMPRGRVELAYVPALPGGGRWARLVGADARRLWGEGGVVGACAVRVAPA